MGASPPPYIPRFGAGQPLGVAPPGTIYYDTANEFQAYIYRGGWQRYQTVLIGAGAPAALAPAGFIYSRSDAAAIYSSQPTLAPPTIVQHAHQFDASFADVTNVTFGAPVTAGNLLIGYVLAFGNTIPFITPAWNILEDLNGPVTQGICVYRYAQAGDGATPPNITNGAASQWVLTMAEISGVTGNIANDIAAHNSANGAANFNTPNIDTTGANQLGLLFEGASSTGTNLTNPAGWTSLELGASSGAGAWLLSSQTPAGGSGVNIGNNAVVYPAGTFGYLPAQQVILAAAQTANWLELAHNP